MVQTVPEDVQSYLAAVRNHLADLSQQERDDLLADVEASLVESANEGESPIATRLGPPESFAEELRAAAGIVTENVAAAPEPTFLDRLAAWYRRVDPRVMRAAREFAPLWWIARAYVAVAALAVLIGQYDYRNTWSTAHPEIPTWGLGKSALVLLALAVAGSCWLGFRTRSTRRKGTSVALNVALLVACIPVLHHLRQPSAADQMLRMLQTYAMHPRPATPGLAIDGQPVTNIYPFTRNGRLLLDVLLYDAAGRPIDLRPKSVDPNRRVLVTTAGDMIFNSFPIRYYEPGTRKVADPAAGPKPGHRRFVTPGIRRVTNP